MKPKVWLLLKGTYYTDGGLVVCAARTRTGLRKWVKENYPAHCRVRQGRLEDELFWENDATRTWLKCTLFDQCPLTT